LFSGGEQHAGIYYVEPRRSAGCADTFKLIDNSRSRRFALPTQREFLKETISRLYFLWFDQNMEVAIEKLVALCCFVIGLSHIVQPRAWAELFIDWRGKGDVGVIYTALLHFCFGALVVAFHNVWHGLPLVVTLLGWGWNVKGLLYLTYPKVGMKMLTRVSIERSWEFVVAGVVLVALGALIAYSLAQRGMVL
jgi:uncharacterized protein YjeT (DUF2065 family)